MANSDAAFGFRPIGRNGGPYNGPLHRVYVPSSDTTTAIFTGDIVKLGGSASTDGYATVTVVTAVGDIPYGVVTGVEANPTNLGLTYKPAGAVAGGNYLKVVLCDEAIFEVQSDGVMTATDVGGNIDYVLGAGSTVTGMSGYEIDASALTTATGDVLQVQGFVDRPDNDLTLTNSKVIVKFNDAATHPDRLGLAT
jgi:hypothetical protein